MLSIHAGNVPVRKGASQFTELSSESHTECTVDAYDMLQDTHL